MSESSSSKRRMLALRIMTLAIPLLFFALLEAGLRIVDYGDNLDLFVPAPADYADADYLMINPAVGERYFPKNSDVPQPTHELFLKDKPQNAYRIFVLGGSTTAGYPYPNHLMFSRILAQRLKDTFAERHIEVINTGIAAMNSYTLIDFMDEILQQKPDAILIYAGHNEFYGALGVASTQSVGRNRWVVKSYLALLRLKTVQLIRNLANAVSTLPQHDDSAATDSSSVNHAKPFPTLMGRVIGEQSIPLDSETFMLAKQQFRGNISEILSKARAANIPVMMSELVSNVRDHKPFVSVEQGEQLPADIVYEWARLLEKESMFDFARETYVWAKDLDGLRFRAPEVFNHIIQQLGAEFNVPVVPMVQYFEQASPNRLIGSHLMLEHLHPNHEGHFIMSEAFFQSMRDHQFIASSWDSKNIKPLDFYRTRWPVTQLDLALGDLRILYLTSHWPFTPSFNSPALATYQAKNMAESLALKVMNNELGIVAAHVNMANYYAEKGQHEQAWREYLALISGAPYDASLYLLAAKRQLDSGQFDQALPFLQHSLKLKETRTVNSWIGRVYLLQSKPQQALDYLERAYVLQAEDVQLLADLSSAYIKTGKWSEAHEIMAKLKKIKPNYFDLPNLEAELSRLSQ